MAKYDVTKELAEIIKSTRIQNKICSKDVATYIKKSQSYMTKLEKGDIKTIDESELTSIFKYIFKNDESFQNFLETTLTHILNTLAIRYSAEEINQQLWFTNYDTVLRLIPIPEALVDDLNQRLTLANITITELCARINANEAIVPQPENFETSPFNKWQVYVEKNQVKSTFIKLKLSCEEIENILSKVTKSSNYITVQAIVYYITKIEKYHSLINIENNENEKLMDETTKYLNSYKFYSLNEKFQLKNQSKNEQEFENMLSSFDKKNIKLLNEIVASFKVYSEIDVENTNIFLSNFAENLNWDNGFMSKLLSIKFFEIKNLSFSLKKQMLREIEDIVEKYNSIPENKKTIEVYE